MRVGAPILTYGIPPIFGGVTYVRIVDIDHMLALEVDYVNIFNTTRIS